jgi:hypothetical protein
MVRRDPVHGGLGEVSFVIIYIDKPLSNCDSHVRKPTWNDVFCRKQLTQFDSLGMRASQAWLLSSVGTSPMTKSGPQYTDSLGTGNTTRVSLCRSRRWIIQLYLQCGTGPVSDVSLSIPRVCRHSERVRSPVRAHATSMAASIRSCRVTFRFLVRLSKCDFVRFSNVLLRSWKQWTPSLPAFS